jgi:hypothetical protein
MFDGLIRLDYFPLWHLLGAGMPVAVDMMQQDFRLLLLLLLLLIQ